MIEVIRKYKILYMFYLFFLIAVLLAAIYDKKEKEDAHSNNIVQNTLRIKQELEQTKKKIVLEKKKITFLKYKLQNQNQNSINLSLVNKITKIFIETFKAIGIKITDFKIVRNYNYINTATIEIHLNEKEEMTKSYLDLMVYFLKDVFYIKGYRAQGNVALIEVYNKIEEK